MDTLRLQLKCVKFAFINEQKTNVQSILNQLALDSHLVPISLFPLGVGCSGSSSPAPPGGSVCTAPGWPLVGLQQGCCRT